MNIIIIILSFGSLFSLQPSDLSWGLPSEVLTKICCDCLLVFHCNSLYEIDGFRDNEILLQAGYESYDVIVVSPLGSTARTF